MGDQQTTPLKLERVISFGAIGRHSTKYQEYAAADADSDQQEVNVDNGILRHYSIITSITWNRRQFNDTHNSAGLQLSPFYIAET